MKMPAIGRPHQYMQIFKVFQQKRAKTEDGTVIQAEETKSTDKIIDGILAKADLKTISAWNQNQNPVSHTIVSYHPVINVRKNDTLELNGRRFVVKGTEDPAGTGQFAIYYVLERNDTNGHKC